MFSGLRSRLKSLRKGDDDARIQRKAKNAAKSITRTASRDLLEWEEKNGYNVTKTHQASNSHSSSSTFVEKQRMGTTPKSKQGSPPTDGFPQNFPSANDVSPAPMIHLHSSDGIGEAGLTDALSLPSTAPAAPDIQQPSAEERDRRITLQLEVEEKEKLLKEIQAIRQSIAHLKTSEAQQQLAPLDTKGLLSSSTPGKSSETTPVTSRTPTSGRRSAPWLAGERSSRPQSMYTSSPASASPALYATHEAQLRTLYTGSELTSRSRPKSVADIFAQDSPQPVSSNPSAATAGQGAPVLQLPPDIVASSAKTSPEEKPSRNESSHHRRNTSLGASAVARPRSQLRLGSETIPPVPVLKRDASGAPIVPPQEPGKMQRSKSPALGEVGQPSQQRASRTRQVIDTPEEARKRASIALGRSRTPPAQSSSKRYSMIANDDGRGKDGGGGMTLAELQERHLAKLKQMQSPTSEKLLQEQALSLAKTEWERRTRIERQEQQRKAKERAEAEQAWQNQQQQRLDAGRPSLSMTGKSRRRTLSEDMLKEQRASGEQAGQGAFADDAPASPKMTAKRMSGAQKAREWRQSLASLSEETRLQALNQSQHHVGRPQATRATTGDGADEFGYVRSRAKSSLGLERPNLTHAAHSAVVGSVPAYGAATFGHYPVFAPPYAAGPSTTMPSSNNVSPILAYSSPMELAGFSPTTPIGGGTGVLMARSSSHSPGVYSSASPSPGGTMARANSYFPPAPSPSHKRQMTATDLRRLQEGAGPGRRPRSAVLNHQASRMSQRVG